MNEQQIRNMKPGPEMDDALVQALGYRGFIRTETGWLYQSESGGIAKGVSSLSTTWEGMGVVVEELRQQKGIFLNIYSLPDEYLVSSSTDPIGAVDSTSAPHAVAMAALLAIGGAEQ